MCPQELETSGAAAVHSPCALAPRPRCHWASLKMRYQILKFGISRSLPLSVSPATSTIEALSFAHPPHDGLAFVERR